MSIQKPKEIRITQYRDQKIVNYSKNIKLNQKIFKQLLSWVD